MSIGVFSAVLGLVAITLFARAMLGAWVAPGAFFPLYWTVLIVASIVSAPDYELQPGGLWWILACLAAFLVGSLITQGSGSHNVSALAPRAVQLPHISGIIVACVVLGCLYVIFRPTVGLSASGAPPALFQVMLSAMWLGPLLAGMLWAASRSRLDRVVGVIGVLPTLVYSIAYLGRSAMLVGIFFSFAGFLSMGVLIRRGSVRILKLRVALLIPVIVVGLAFVGMSISAMRYINNSEGPGQELSTLEKIALFPSVLSTWDFSTEWLSFRSAVFGNPYSFTYYFSYALEHPPTPQFGALTFGGPLELLGIRERTPYDSFEIDPNVMSNVYTLFMPPIEDFGFTGALASFFLSGVIAGWAYRRTAAGSVLPLPLLAMFYPHVLVIGGYFFSYNSHVLTFVVLGAYLWYYQRDIVLNSDRSPLSATVPAGRRLGMRVRTAGHPFPATATPYDRRVVQSGRENEIVRLD